MRQTGPSTEPWGTPQSRQSVSYLSVDGVHLLQDISKAAVHWFLVNGRRRQPIEEVPLKERRLRADRQLRHSVLKTQRQEALLASCTELQVSSQITNLSIASSNKLCVSAEYSVVLTPVRWLWRGLCTSAGRHWACADRRWWRLLHTAEPEESQMMMTGALRYLHSMFSTTLPMSLSCSIPGTLHR